MTNAQDGASKDDADLPVDLDPYFDWVLGIGRPNFFLPGRQQVWMPVLVKLKGISAKEFATGAFLQGQGPVQQWESIVMVPDLYQQGPIADEKDAHCFAMVTEKFHQLLTDPQHSFIRNSFAMVELGLPVDRESLPEDWFK
jgi:hypothetical protein